MKITSVEIIPIDQKHKGRLIFSSGPTPASDEFIILRINTDEGICGVGSAYAFPTYPLLQSGCTREAAMYIMKDLAKLLIGEDPMRLSYLIEKLEKAIIGFYTENWYVLSHFDHALYDLKGKILGVPVYELLGGMKREEIPLEYIVSFLPTPEEVAEEAKKVIDLGYKAVKVHVNRDPKNAEARVKAVREAIGSDVPLSIDMGMAYNLPDAVKLINDLDAKYNLNFVEQPLHPYDLDGSRQLRYRTNVPITADHSGMSLKEAYYCVKDNLFDSYHCLITRIGGLSRAQRYCDMMETARLNYQICNMDNSIAGAAAAHFAVSRSDRGGRFYDELGLYLYLHGTYDTASITDDIVKEQAAEIKNGVLHAPKGPGLGVELDEEMLARYAAPGLNKIIVQ